MPWQVSNIRYSISHGICIRFDCICVYKEISGWLHAKNLPKFITAVTLALGQSYVFSSNREVTPNCVHINCAQTYTHVCTEETEYDFTYNLWWDMWMCFSRLILVVISLDNGYPMIHYVILDSFMSMYYPPIVNEHLNLARYSVILVWFFLIQIIPPRPVLI